MFLGISGDLDNHKSVLNIILVTEIIHSSINLMYIKILNCNYLFILSEPKDEPEAEKTDAVTDSDMQQENGVLVLTNENFNDIVETSFAVLVEFYAPW